MNVCRNCQAELGDCTCGNSRPLYDTCGCIAPCPDHKSPTQDAQRDRDYWNERYETDYDPLDYTE